MPVLEPAWLDTFCPLQDYYANTQVMSISHIDQAIPSNFLFWSVEILAQSIGQPQ